MSTKKPTIAPAEGKLGVLTVGLGAVASTLIAGVELAKRGLGAPIGSLTQMDTIRLGKRTDGRNPMIKDFVPLARLEDIVWGAWDVFPDDAYVAASRAGVLEQGKHIEAGQLWAGSPARFVRDLNEAAIAGMRLGVAHYVNNAKLHAAATAVG